MKADKSLLGGCFPFLQKLRIKTFNAGLTGSSKRASLLILTVL
jgi:hypothetical protein